MVDAVHRVDSEDKGNRAVAALLRVKALSEGVRARCKVVCEDAEAVADIRLTLADVVVYR